MDNEVRIDKWLWSIRVFKSRSMASNACKTGRVKLNEKTAKASHSVKIGDKLIVRKNGFDLQFKVLQIISKRVSYSLAAPCYENITPVEELHKFKSWFIGKGNAEQRDQGTGRPTKKERREIEEFKDDFLFNWDE